MGIGDDGILGHGSGGGQRLDLGLGRVARSAVFHVVNPDGT